LAETSSDRVAPRARTLLQARIEFNNGATTVDCTVRDMSETGARLQVSDNVALPPGFALYVPKHARRYEVHQRWRREGFVGIEFDAGSRPYQDGSEADHEKMARLEAEVARLRRVIAAIRADPSQARLLLERFDTTAA
jgi:hypothetical protein